MHAALVSVCLIAACGSREPAPFIAPAETPIPSTVVTPVSSAPAEVPGDDIADVREIPQTLTALAAEAPSPWTEAELGLQAETLRARLYRPWDHAKTRQSATHLNEVFARFALRSLWGEDLRPRPRAWIEAMHANAALDAWPNVERHGVTTRHVAVRFLPSLQPGFADPSQPGEGFPFDYLQASLLHAGTPVFVAHQSQDGAWLYIESHLVNGWVRGADIAFADAAFMSTYRSDRLYAMLADDAPLWDADGLHRGLTRVGQLLPSAKDHKSVWVAARNAVGMAVAIAVTPPPESHLVPAPSDPAAFAAVADRLLGQAYGWGGTLEDRDCSATMADLFATVGISLPRHSGNQAKVGTWVDLEGLDGPAKEAMIAADGIPFATLLWKPGHILLYVGVGDAGRPLAFHTMWGVKTRAPGADALGRKVVGRTVITTLTPGAERSDYEADESILAGIRGMSLLATRLGPTLANQPDAEASEVPDTASGAGNP